MYQMVGSCMNCHAEEVLVLYTVGHKAVETTCPVCENKSVVVRRLATEEELVGVEF
jgi:hypothetical protein